MLTNSTDVYSLGVILWRVWHKLITVLLIFNTLGQTYVYILYTLPCLLFTGDHMLCTLKHNKQKMYSLINLCSKKSQFPPTGFAVEQSVLANENILYIHTLYLENMG